MGCNGSTRHGRPARRIGHPRGCDGAHGASVRRKAHVVSRQRLHVRHPRGHPRSRAARQHHCRGAQLPQIGLSRRRARRTGRAVDHAARRAGVRRVRLRAAADGGASAERSASRALRHPDEPHVRGRCQRRRGHCAHLSCARRASLCGRGARRAPRPVAAVSGRRARGRGGRRGAERAQDAAEPDADGSLAHPRGLARGRKRNLPPARHF